MSNTPLDPLVADIPESKRRLLDRTDQIAVRIGALMRERGLNQTELAKRVKKSKSYVSRVLSGTVNLTLKTVSEFEAALGDDVVTVPAWEPPYPRRRRRSSSAVVKAEANTAEEVQAKGLAARLPDVLCERLKAIAAAQKTSVEALVTLWVAERLLHDPAGSTGSIWLSEVSRGLDKTAVEFKHGYQDWCAGAAHVVYFFPETDYASSPYRMLDPQRVRTCVGPGGQLVEAGAFTLLGSDPDTNER